METKHTKFPTPPWDMEIAAERLVFEEATFEAGSLGCTKGADGREIPSRMA